MANNKTGFSYYNTDTDKYLDMRIKRLKKAFSCSGIAIYDYILCEIYREKGCFMQWDESTAFDVAEYFSIKESLVNEVVKYCGVVGLFNKELLTSGNVLTSLSIQRRFIEMSKKYKRAFYEIPKHVFIPEESPIIPEESPIIPEESPIIPPRACAVGKEMKGKERRGRINTPPPPILNNPIVDSNNSMLGFQETWAEFMNSRQWHEKLCMDYYLEMGFLITDMENFLKKLNSQSQFPRKLSDTKAYYFNCLQKALKAESEKKAAVKKQQFFYEDCPTLD